MGEATKIQWTDHTFNPWRGCAKVHGGCTNCYAETQQRRFGVAWGEVWQGGQRIVAADSTWAQPMKWARAAARAGVRRRVFCGSLADVLEVPADAPDSLRDGGWAARRVAETRDTMAAARARLWDAIRETAHVCQGCHRPHAMSADLPGRTARLNDLASVGAACEGRDGRCVNTGSGGLDWLLLTKRPEHWELVPEDVRPLVWLGTSVSDQTTADEWVPRLLKAEGFQYRFLSLEPMVGRVDLTNIRLPSEYDLSRSTPAHINALVTHDDEHFHSDHPRIDWVIVGGESGSKARPCSVGWVRRVLDQCKAAGVPCFIKQMGSKAGWSTTIEGPPWVPWELSDPKGGDMTEWPEDLRVREVPRG